MRNRDDYRFLRLADAMTALNQKVNLIGIIAEYGTPTRSRGTDWFCSLRIVDESHNVRGLLVNIFAETQEKLPQVKASGDIIQLSQVLMKTHNKETYALFNKKFSSFALYEGKNGENYNPYQVSSMFRPRNQDTTFVDGLRKWVDSFQLDSVSEESVLLRQIKEGQCYDLVCKVLHVSQVDQEEWMLFVWDGSDAPIPQLLSKLHTEKENPLPLQLEPQPLARETLCKFPTIGTILRVSVDQKNVKLNISSVSAGRWVKFINLMFKVHEGLWYGVLTSSTKVRFLPNEDLVILERQRDYEKRLSSKLDRMPFTSFPWPCRITEVDDKVEDVPLVTLMDIMTYPQVAGKYKCIVRVVAALPWTIEDFRSPDGTYRIRLTLEDPTGRIHAYLYAEDGEVFFEGNPPMDALIRKWNTLLGVAEVDSGGVIENAPRNPPWVLCCIKSYYADKNDVWGSRKYRIFDTKLVC
ncbi:protection of telomeres protein 1b-like [Chenopodium quinoa]|nr:protection of telomeres protein 1b-like [Chenopodium quinoa]